MAGGSRHRKACVCVCSNTPGPGAYNLPRGSQGKGFSIGMRYRPREAEDIPGPAAYHQNDKKFRTTGGFFSVS
jgi:hypothetical protein